MKKYRKDAPRDVQAQKICKAPNPSQRVEHFLALIIRHLDAINIGRFSKWDKEQITEHVREAWDCINPPEKMDCTWCNTPENLQTKINECNPLICWECYNEN